MIKNINDLCFKELSKYFINENRISSNKVYDKVKWHYPDGKCKSLDGCYYTF